MQIDRGKTDSRSRMLIDNSHQCNHAGVALPQHLAGTEGISEHRSIADTLLPLRRDFGFKESWAIGSKKRIANDSEP